MSRQIAALDTSSDASVGGVIVTQFEDLNMTDRIGPSGRQKRRRQDDEVRPSSAHLDSVLLNEMLQMLDGVNAQMTDTSRQTQCVRTLGEQRRLEQ